MKKTFAILALSVSSLAFAGSDGKDPLEGFNRGVYSFNKGIDKAFKPVAQAYSDYVPEPIVIGIGNFFGNIADLPGTLNLLLQGKPRDSFETAGRFLLNTTIGIGGLFDFASSIGIEKRDTDFGKTLATWGVGEGAYLVLPLLGPSTIRDAGGKVVDFSLDPVAQHTPIPERNSALFTRATDQRASLLPVDKVIEEGALDEYSFVRDAWLQKRRRDTDTMKKYEEQEEDEPTSEQGAAPVPAETQAEAVPQEEAGQTTTEKKDSEEQ